MSAVRQIQSEPYDGPSVISAIKLAERELADLFGFAGRLHQANIEHDPHSCVLCFESR